MATIRASARAPPFDPLFAARCAALRQTPQVRLSSEELHIDGEIIIILLLLLL
jgi:hypothetical protein